MLRIACLYESRLGRNDGNPLYVWHDLKKRQELKQIKEVNHLAPTGDLSLFGRFDAFIWSDWGEDGLTHILPYKPVFPKQNGIDPVVYWPTDTHVDGASYEYRLGLARQADIVYTAQKVTVDQFAKDGVVAKWLPCAVDPQAFPKYEKVSKHYDICFIGHINSQHRIDHLDRAFKEFPNFFYGQRFFEEAADKFADSKICLNVALNDDVNMRCFEVTGSGGFLLTNRIPSLEELFVDGKEIVMYDSMDDMIEKAKYYLEHDEEREAIAKAGYERAMRDHQMSMRVDVMLEDIKKFKEKKKEKLNAELCEQAR